MGYIEGELRIGGLGSVCFVRRATGLYAGSKVLGLNVGIARCQVQGLRRTASGFSG